MLVKPPTDTRHSEVARFHVKTAKLTAPLINWPFNVVWAVLIHCSLHYKCNVPIFLLGPPPPNMV